MVSDEHFIVKIHDNLSLDAVVPLFYAGITTYSPLRYIGLDNSGTNLGMVGLSGLGHYAVKFAKAFGANVTFINTSISKKNEAIKRLGADSFLINSDPDQMKSHEKNFIDLRMMGNELINVYVDVFLLLDGVDITNLHVPYYDHDHHMICIVSGPYETRLGMTYDLLLAALSSP
ncbi:8-hydroxygeraniol dehydrogenase-like [Impatiens glandulifera]|uniref:8-hydroxygeraniol dehydrogenase-like n=1 Tax=Impatiens glandulifera TaxID=253017 RepID=UPI001FB16C7F|nr:8-hydroxygeraniol dehydrogenase-like [Impatiens glandulifera]